MKRGVGAVLAAGTVLAAACGGGGDDIVLPAISQQVTTTTMPLTVSPSTTPGVGGTGSPAGVSTTTVDARTWQPAGANLVGLPSECGNVQVTSMPGRDAVVAGAAQNGLFAADPSGGGWIALGTGGGDAVHNLMNGIVVDPDRPDTWWESGSYGDKGVYRTDDNGMTFRGLGDLRHVDYMSVDFTDPARATLLAGGHERPVLYRSTDGGSTWGEVGGLPADIGAASSPLVIDSSTYLLGSAGGPGSGVFRTADAGATWSKVSDLPVVGAPLVQDGKILWLRTGGGGVLVSTDQGLTWTEMQGRGISQDAAQLIGLPDGRAATLGRATIVVSSDDGARWIRVGPPFPSRIQGIAYAPDRDVWYATVAGCEGGNLVVEGSILQLAPAG